MMHFFEAKARVTVNVGGTERVFSLLRPIYKSGTILEEEMLTLILNRR